MGPGPLVQSPFRALIISSSWENLMLKYLVWLLLSFFGLEALGDLLFVVAYQSQSTKEIKYFQCLMDQQNSKDHWRSLGYKKQCHLETYNNTTVYSPCEYLKASNIPHKIQLIMGISLSP